MKSKNKGDTGKYYDSIMRLNERILTSFEAVYKSNYLIDSSGKTWGIRLNARVVSPLNVFGPIIYGSVMHGFPQKKMTHSQICLTFRNGYFKILTEQFIRVLQ